MGRDARRTFLVIAPEVDLFAALRPILDSEMLQVSWATPADARTALAEIVPWPWAVGGVGVVAPSDLLAVVEGLPVLWFWLGDAPALLRGRARVHPTWRGIAEDAAECLRRSLGGMRLAPNRGLIGPHAELILSAELEGLVAHGQMPVPLSAAARDRARRALSQHGLSASLEQGDGGILLVDR